MNENESLQRSLRERQPSAPLNLDKDSLLNIHGQQIKLLEDEKDGMARLYEESREIIHRLEQEINDLKNPLKPHLIRLEMQTKQVSKLSHRCQRSWLLLVCIRFKKNTCELKKNFSKKFVWSVKNSCKKVQSVLSRLGIESLFSSRKRNRELVTSQLRTKELEHQNQTLQAEIHQKVRSELAWRTLNALFVCSRKTIFAGIWEKKSVTMALW